MRIVFIVPYKNRPSDLNKFLGHLTDLKQGAPPHIDVDYIISEQTNSLHFNRGAMKNLGAMHKVRNTSEMNHTVLVFHDIDIFLKNIKVTDYLTHPGLVKHFYGYLNLLGGVFSIHALDFFRINGFPNYWGWGWEDNLIYQRCLSAGIATDRSLFKRAWNKQGFVGSELEQSVEDRKFVSLLCLTKYLEKKSDGLSNIRIYKSNYVSKNHAIFDIFTTLYPCPRLLIPVDCKSSLQKYGSWTQIVKRLKDLSDQIEKRGLHDIKPINLFNPTLKARTDRHYRPIPAMKFRNLPRS